MLKRMWRQQTLPMNNANKVFTSGVLLFGLGIMLVISGCSTKRSLTQSECPPCTGNLAEYWGKCPKCGRWAKGYYSRWSSDDGREDSGSGVLGKCGHCSVNLIASPSKRSGEHPQVVSWRVPE